MDTMRITADDVLRPGSRWRDCEIWDGIPMVREPSGGWSDAVAARVVVALGAHAREHDLGWTFLGSQGFLLARNPDRLLASDSAFVAKERLPRIPQAGFVEVCPDFLIEVRSPTDSWEATVEKCGIWIGHGARCVWAVDPGSRTVAVMRPGRAPQIVRGSGPVNAAPALPDFALDVAGLFEGFEE